MSYVDSQLLPGESVVYRARLDKSIFTIPGILGALTLIVLVASYWYPEELFVGGIFGALFVSTALSAYTHYSGSEFAVTNKRVIMKTGWIRRRTLETMLAKVEGIGVDQTLLGRMFNFGTIEVTGTGGTKESFKRIAQPLEFRRQVQGAIASGDSAPAFGAPRQERDCPFCAERILAKAKICKHCGRDVSATATP